MSPLVRVDEVLQRLGRGLFAPSCVLCESPGAGGRDLCAHCADALPWNTVACPVCALPLAAPAPACARCLRRAPPFFAAVAPLRYAADARRLLTRYKFGADLAVGRVLAALLADAVHARVPPDRVVPVPLHRSRLRERGFDQAWELARAVARAHGLAAQPDALRRQRATTAQTGLDAAARRRNLRAAFVAESAVAGLRVALVDDVVTTGATVAAAAGALRAAGARSVEVWALARAPR